MQQAAKMKEMSWCFLLWVALAAPVLGQGKPNIVFILSDDQGEST